MKNTLLLFLSCNISLLFAQNNPEWDDRSDTVIDEQSKTRFSIGINSGVPFLYDLEVEMFPPFLGEKIAVFAKYGYYDFKLNQTGISLDGNGVNVTGVFDTELPLISDITNQIADAFVQEVFATTSTQINYAAFGVKYYLKKDNSGFYGSLGIALLNTNFIFTDVPIISTDGDMITQEIPFNENLTFPQFKIGYRSKKRFYVKADAGIMLSNLPNNINYSNSVDFLLFNVNYDYNINFPKIPRISDGLILSFGIGTGYRF